MPCRDRGFRLRADPLIEVVLIHYRDFQLTTPKRPNGFGDFNHLAVVKIQTSDRITRLRMSRLFFDGERRHVPEPPARMMPFIFLINLV